jgi:hypothetical protein
MYLAVLVAYLRLFRAIVIEQRYDEILKRKDEVYKMTNVKPEELETSLQVLKDKKKKEKEKKRYR